MRHIQWFLDTFSKARTHLLAAIVFCSMRIYALEVRIRDIRNATYAVDPQDTPSVADAKALDNLLAVAKEGLAESQDRRSSIADKSKTLLTIASLALAITALVLPGPLEQEGWRSAAMLVAALALLNVIVLLLAFLGVGKDATVCLEQGEIALNADDLKRSLLKSYLQCQAVLERRTDYLLNVYETARFFLLAAFSIIVVVTLAGFWSSTDTSPSDMIIRKLRGEPALIEILKGPKGDRGEPGQKAVIDYDVAVERVLADPRLKRLLEEHWAKRQRPAQKKGSK